MLILRITETITVGGAALLSNPSFVRLGLIGLFINSLLSSVIPVPTELTTSGLLLAGQSKTTVFTILVIGSIIGGFIAYYIGYGGIRFLNRLRKGQNKKDEFRTIAVKRLKQEGIENEELALFIANAVLRDLGRKSVRDVIRIARKSNTIQDVEETIQTLKKYDLKRTIQHTGEKDKEVIVK